MLKKLLLVSLLLLGAVLVPLAGSAVSPGACYKQCLIDAGCGPGGTNPDCYGVSESCRCKCYPPEYSP